MGRQRKTVVYPAAVNYRDPSGAWEPIDNNLMADPTTGSGWRNSANAFSVELPATAATPARVTVGSGWLTIGLAGATGTGTAKGSTVSYPGALPGVSETFGVTNTGFDTSVSLANATAGSQFRYPVTVSTGVTLHANANGTISVNGLGAPAEFGSPSMRDAAGATSTAMTETLTGDATAGYVIAVSADPAWLSAPQRAFPVVIDPPWDTTAGNSSDPACTLSQGSPTTSSCSSSTVKAGFDGTNASRAVLQFNDLYSAGLEPDSEIESAQLSMDATAATTGTAASVGLYPVTSAWTTAATWNTKDGTHAWSSAGGDYSTTPAWTTSVAGTGTYTWQLTGLVQGWANQSQANAGLILKQTTETTNNLVSFASWNASNSSTWPTLTIYYNQGWGQEPWYQTDTVPITGRSSLEINDATGNVLLHNSDIDVAGTGLGMNWDSYYNSLDADDYNESGYGWTFSNGSDIVLDLYPDAVSMQEPGESHGEAWDLVSSAWTARPGVDATLANSGSTWTVTTDNPQQILTFSVLPGDSTHAYLTQMADPNGDKVTIAYDSSNSVHKITDTRGRTLTFGWDPTTGALTSVTESTGRAVYYGYNSSLQLTSYTDANSNVTHYAYDSHNNLTKVTDPVGNVILLAYGTHPAYHQLTAITRVLNTTAQTGPTTTYNQDWDMTTVPPTGHATVTANGATSNYTFDTADAVTSASNVLGASTSVSYTGNPDNQPTSSTNADGQTATTTYSPTAPSDPTAVTAPPTATGQSPATDTVTYNTPSTVTGYQWLPSSVTDAEGNCTANVYDTAGLITDTYSGQTSPCDGHTGGIHTFTRYQGDPGVTSCGGQTGEACSTTNGNGNTTTYAYDTHGQLTTITPPSPLHTTAYTYDAESRTATITDGNGTRTYSYDNLDRVTQVLYGGATTCTPSSGNCIAYTYDADGNQTQMVDNTGTTTWAYDALSRLAKETPSNASTNTCSTPNDAGITYSYDDTGNPIATCNSAGTTGYAYDSAGDLLATRTPITQVGLTNTSGTSLTSLTLALPAEIQANDQIIVAVTVRSTITVTTPTGYTLVGTYTTGNTRQVILRRTAVAGDSSVTVALSASTTAAAVAGVYRGVSTTSPIDATSSSGATGTSLTVGAVTTTGNSDELLLAASATGTFAPGSTFTPGAGLYADQNADPANISAGLSSQTLTASGSTGSRTATFPTSSALEAVLVVLTPATTAVPTTYTYDASGNRLSTNYPDGVSQNMTYNGAAELTGINAIKNSGPTTLANYTYTWASGANDRDQSQTASESVAGTTYSYTYDAYNRLTRAQETAGGTNSYQYTYDNDGNPLTENLNGTTTTNTYNTADQACWSYTGATSNTCSSAPTGATTYSYDSTGNGNLTASSAGFSASYNTKQQTTSITPAGGSATPMSYAGEGQGTRTAAGSTTFVNDSEGIASSTLGGAPTTYVTEPDGTLTSITTGGATYYYLYDGEGNVVGLVDSSGTRQATYGYDPYGNTTSSGTDASINPYRYRGGYEDSTGLYHFGNRYYNPVNGEWTQLDPSGQSPGYIYADDDPIDNSDPSGDSPPAGYYWIPIHLTPWNPSGTVSNANGVFHVQLNYGNSTLQWSFSLSLAANFAFRFEYATSDWGVWVDNQGIGYHAPHNEPSNYLYHQSLGGYKYGGKGATRYLHVGDQVKIEFIINNAHAILGVQYEIFVDY